jgi:hypothetical protein
MAARVGDRPRGQVVKPDESLVERLVRQNNGFHQTQAHRRVSQCSGDRGCMEPSDHYIVLAELRAVEEHAAAGRDAGTLRDGRFDWRARLNVEPVEPGSGHAREGGTGRQTAMGGGEQLNRIS